MLTKVFTVRVNDYFPELCEITLPWIKAYAKRIGAEFHEITERKFPDFPPTYEKLQIHELGADSQWNILIDADMVLNSNFPDVTQFNPQEIGLYMTYDASFLFEPDQYFVRDGRRLGIATNFLAVHHCNHDVWTPLEMPFSVAQHKTKRLHIIDEYCFSRNVARFGLKVNGVYHGVPLPAPRPILSDPLLDDLIHLDVSTNSKKDVLDVARKVDQMWKTNANNRTISPK